MKIIIYGAYGAGNIGDEATLEVLIKRFSKAFLGANIQVFSANPKETESMHSVKTSRPNLVQLLKSDVLVIEDLDTVIKFIMGILGRIFRKRVIYYAIGAPNLNMAMKLMIPLALNVKEVYFRDWYSANKFRQYGFRRPVTVIPDPAIYLEPIDKTKTLKLLIKNGVDTNKHLFGFCLRYSRTKELDDQLKKLIAPIFEWLVKEIDAEIVLIPMCRHIIAKLEKDELFAEELRKYVKYPNSVKILTSARPQDVKGVFSVMDVVIGMRLHSAVFAYSTGVPFIGLVTGWRGYDEKIVSFMKTFCHKSPLLLSNIDPEFLKQEITKLAGLNYASGTLLGES